MIGKDVTATIAAPSSPEDADWIRCYSTGQHPSSTPTTANSSMKRMTYLTDGRSRLGIDLIAHTQAKGCLMRLSAANSLMHLGREPERTKCFPHTLKHLSQYMSVYRISTTGLHSSASTVGQRILKPKQLTCHASMLRIL